MITARIKTKFIDKSKLVTDKNGNICLDICLIETPQSQYGDDYMVTQSVSKEDRANGVKGPILGNAKIWNKPAAQAAAPAQAPRTTPPLREDGEYPTPESLPF